MTEARSRAAKHLVTVWDKPHEITVHQKSKSVWVAVGDYMGKRLEVTGRSQTQAINSWRDAARYRGN